MRLHAPEAKSILYASEGWQPPAGFDPCTGLQGKSAKIFTTDVKADSNFPEIISIQLRPNGN
ncbi:MAG TPA: hypothetical protein VFO39_03195 [Candidatus Sulfotelmatobacter sp.]|nr:hypothetical protein [Candidatus Sulfotelmatobacter sp.]